MRVSVCDLLFVVTVKVAIALGETTLPLETPIRHQNCQGLDDMNHPIFLPYSNDCNKYYSCKNGLAYLLSCPNQLHWSIINNRCDYPEVAKCEVSSTPAVIANIPAIVPPIYTTSKPLPIGSLPLSESSSYHPYPGDCNRFYQCEVMRCPPNFHWNALLHRCDFPHIAACANVNSLVPPTTVLPLTTIPLANIPNAATPPPTAATPPSTFSPFINTIPWNPFENATETADLNELCAAGGAKYIHYPNDCHKFIQCNGIAFVQTCPAGLYWNGELLTCDRYCK